MSYTVAIDLFFSAPLGPHLGHNSAVRILSYVVFPESKVTVQSFLITKGLRADKEETLQSVRGNEGMNCSHHKGEYLHLYIVSLSQ